MDHTTSSPEAANTTQEYLTAAQVAQMTGFTLKALEAKRSRREGPRFFKIGASVRYRAADVRAWIEGGAS